MESTSNKKVVFLLAPQDFRDEEYFQPKVIIQSKGIDVFTAVKGDPEEVTGTQGGKARPDISFESILSENYDGLILVGGAGSKIYIEDPDVQSLVQRFHQEGKLVAAICSATGILASSGILSGLTVTGFDDVKNIVEQAGASWSGKDIEQSGTIITARDADVSLAFGSKIAEFVNS